ncbi:type II CAAX endopeptidase family protein [Paenibacillus sp. HB172176]|uniref:CPBP family intramembrane glutamic endopeptidase n=1 Tax=Paenibacillus sp. HB172176 TaxID=2493690 RepID=UPI00143AF9BA|nr:type II CAAX endopeptidase family protein [Paenibacillus sp. HB172176]
MIDLIKHQEWKKYIAAAAVFTVIFLLLEIYPSFTAANQSPYEGEVIEAGQAEQLAVKFAEEQTGLSAVSAVAMHQSDKLVNGYLSKEKLIEDYEDSYDRAIPTDTYQVNMELGQSSYHSFVYVHMYTKQITGWNFILPGDRPDETDERQTLQRLLYSRDFKESETADLQRNEKGEWSVSPTGYGIGEAKLRIVMRSQLIDGKAVVTEYKPAFVVPDSYVQYVEDQDHLAKLLTNIGYLLMSIVLGILAIVYAILYRKHTSFKYGSWLTVIFFIAYLIMNLNVLKGIRASQGETWMSDAVIVVTIVFTIILAVPMAASIYFSMVAGDGLWKAQGRKLWPRLGQPGYGQYVWRSMGLAYLFAAILLGLQPLIFILLSNVIGTWGTSDVTMSPYNMSVLWLMPVLAWAAAISEEAVYRFFGIGLFRKWFRSTFIAALIPTLSWALGHVMYPFYPATTRLIELMVIGLLFSFIFVKYGFITSMFTHAIFNSVAVGSSLFMIGKPIDMISAAFFIALPLFIAWLLRKLDRRRQGEAVVTSSGGVALFNPNEKRE